jgi:PPOX class probable F420-dependent enzyme
VANQIVPESHLDILRKRSFAHVATLGPNGELHSSPVWFDFDGEFIYFSTTKARQKYKNLKANKKVALSLLDPDNPYRYLEIRGEVEQFIPDEGNKFIDKLAKKYLSLEHYPFDSVDDERVIIKIKPLKTSKMG